jgi:hypothetical protein
VRYKAGVVREVDGRAGWPAVSAFGALIADLAAAYPKELGHLDPRSILVIAGAARGEARASIRPLTFGGRPPRRVLGDYQKPRIEVGGHEILYELCLRPRYFLGSTAEERLLIFLHELWHISPRFDGSLAEERRHRVAGEREAATIEGLARAFSPSGPAATVLSHQGELRVLAWLSRPPSRLPKNRALRSYHDADLYEGRVLQSDRVPSFIRRSLGPAGA